MLVLWHFENVDHIYFFYTKIMCQYHIYEIHTRLSRKRFLVLVLACYIIAMYNMYKMLCIIYLYRILYDPTTYRFIYRAVVLLVKTLEWPKKKKKYNFHCNNQQQLLWTKECRIVNELKCVYFEYGKRIVTIICQ